ncbi:MAG: hypothetical protein JW765_04365 [Deltaproteobacteria bacterium]|nr:hypothetical protein [Candidatus Zymogenaceae bacterium]
MNRYLLPLLVLFALFLTFPSAFASESATVTEDSIPLMKGPSFISEEMGGVTVSRGYTVEVISRTSFTDRLAALPDDYWYLVRYRESGVLYTGYVHGSALALDAAATIPVFDPPEYSPNKPTASGIKKVTSSIDGGCERHEGVIVVPEGTMATHFTIKRFDSSFTPCPDGGFGSIIGFSIISAANPAEELFSYEEHIADDPAELQYIKDGFHYFDLDPGSYTVTVRGGPDTTLELTYEMINAQ